MAVGLVGSLLALPSVTGNAGAAAAFGAVALVLPRKASLGEAARRRLSAGLIVVALAITLICASGHVGAAAPSLGMVFGVICALLASCDKGVGEGCSAREGRAARIATALLASLAGVALLVVVTGRMDSYRWLIPGQGDAFEIGQTARLLAGVSMVCLALVGRGRRGRLGRLLLMAGEVCGAALLALPLPFVLSAACAASVALSLGACAIQGLADDGREASACRLAGLESLAFAVLRSFPSLLEAPVVASGTAPALPPVVALSLAGAVLVAISREERSMGGVGEAEDELHPPVWEAFSSREREVVRHLLAGRTVREIAAELGVSRGTVGTYCARIYQKAGVGSRGELVGLVGSAGGEGSSDSVSARLWSPPRMGYRVGPICAACLLGGGVATGLLGVPEGALPALCALGLSLPQARAWLAPLAILACGVAALGVCLAAALSSRRGAEAERVAWAVAAPMALGAVLGALGVFALGPAWIPPLMIAGIVGCVSATEAFGRRAQVASRGAEATLAGRLRSRGLTEAEVRVALRLACGQSAREIAEEFVVSRKTVATQRRSLYRKLGVHGREELTRLVADGLDEYERSLVS